MARPKKDGLEYFPLDVHAGNDDEIELLEAAHGLEGFAIFIKLLQSIYRNGYYINWTKKEQLIFSKRVSATETIVNAVITSCIEWGLFNQKLFEEYKILTSHGIQQRFAFAIGRRSALEMYKEYLLLTEKEVSVTKNLVIVTLTGVSVDINPQSKVKERESKEKEKVKESSSKNKEQPLTKEQETTKRVARMIEGVFGRLASSYEIDMLSSYHLESGLEIDLVEKALAETIESGVRNIKYTKSILDRCVQENLLTVDQYLIDKENKKQKKVKESGTHRESPGEIKLSDAEITQLNANGEYPDNNDIGF